MELLEKAIFIGVLATMALDIWSQLLAHVFNLPATNWALVGRWFGHMPGGVFIHRPIGKSEAVPNEQIIGWSAHYIIGVIYAWLYLVLITQVLNSEPRPVSALLFGLATVVAPWFILQPGMGLGIFARFAPDPAIKRLTSLLAHSVFGLSLYAGWWLIKFIA